MIDRRTGKQDYFNRYKVYTRDTNIKDSLSINDSCVGILHAKDVSAYRKQHIINKYSQTNISAVIESYDIISLNPFDKIYSINEDKWYTIMTVDEESENNSQMRSRRPIIKKTISITTNE